MTTEHILKGYQVFQQISGLLNFQSGGNYFEGDTFC